MSPACQPLRLTGTNAAWLPLMVMAPDGPTEAWTGRQGVGLVGGQSGCDSRRETPPQAPRGRRCACPPRCQNEERSGVLVAVKVDGGALGAD